MNKVNNGIKACPPCERPYERCMEYGPEALSDAELLAVILRNGTAGCDVRKLAEKVLASLGGDISGICHATYRELTSIGGIGGVKAIQILCMAQIAKRIWKEGRKRSEEPICVREAAAYYMQDLRYMETEHVYALMLDTRLRRVDEYHASIGSVNASAVPVREIIRAALRCDAVHVILIHNHPSGDPTPSECDREVTVRLRNACEIAGLRLFDSIIIGDGNYFSFREERQLF